MFERFKKSREFESNRPTTSDTAIVGMAETHSEAMRMLCEDFLRMCPEMEKVACTPTALKARYIGYAQQGRRPELPQQRTDCRRCLGPSHKGISCCEA